MDPEIESHGRYCFHCVEGNVDCDLCWGEIFFWFSLFWL